MDHHTFDGLTRTIARTSPTRRGVLAVIAGSTIGSLVAHLGWIDAEAKKKRKKRRKCKRSQKKCGKRCIPKANCCTNANCGSSGACIAGRCHCLSGFKDCQGACIPDSQCCPSNCDDGNPCTTSICNNGACIHTPVDEGTDCGAGQQCSGDVCDTPPQCLNFNAPCEGGEGGCCSGVCIDVDDDGFTECTRSGAGQPCWYDIDCLSGSCVGFVCRQP